MKAIQQVPCMFAGKLPADVDQAYTNALIIMQGRCWAFYSILLNTTVVWPTHPEVKTLATDGAYIYVNPNFFMGLENDQQRAFGLAHEIGHICLRHPMRGQFYKARGFHSMVKGAQLEWDHKQYNRAGDFVINADLVAHTLEAIPDVLFDDRFGRDDLVDQVYITIMNEQESDPDSGDVADGDAADDESEVGEQSPMDGGEPDGDEAQLEGDDGVPGDPDEGEGDDDGEGGQLVATPHDGHDTHLEPQYDGTPDEQEADQQADLEEIERKIDDALDSLDDAMGRGERHCSPSGPIGEAGYIHSDENGVASHTDWHGELIEEVTRGGTGGEQCYAPINRRKFVNYGIVAPTEMGTFDRLGFVIDISGSVDRKMLQQAMHEVANAIDMLEPISGCLVMFVNTEVYEWHEVMTGSELLDLEIPMCGCTYMAAAIPWMESMGFDCDMTLVFTDGEMDDSDWMECAEADFLMVLDHHPDSWMSQNIKASGARVIVASDVALAA